VAAVGVVVELVADDGEGAVASQCHGRAWCAARPPCPMWRP
jgi:hypothetical protein